MKVKDLMTREPRTCSPDTTLAAAAHLHLGLARSPARPSLRGA
jgi:CBS domain-containing protein